MYFVRTFSRHISLLLFSLALGICIGCNATKNLGENEYLLRKNKMQLETPKGVSGKGVLKENLQRQIIQKPNTYALGVFPYKVWLYNLRQKKYETDTTNFQLESGMVERPVIFDSTLMNQSVLQCRSYLFNQGFFYPKVRDTVVYRNKKAYTHYEVESGDNFHIGKTWLNVDDSVIHDMLLQSMEYSVLQPGIPFTMSLLEAERSRIANYFKEQGYYYFSHDNIVDFSLDTFQKITHTAHTHAKDKRHKPTLDITIFIRSQGNPNAYKKFYLNRIIVYPDFAGREDWRDSSMLHKDLKGVVFRYHNYYVKENVILKHLYLEKGKLYSQSDHENTINKLTQLGIFQTVRTFFTEDTSFQESDKHYLNAIILLTPTDKMDYGINFEVSNGTTYILGSSLTLNFRNRNFGKGANLFTTSLSGGIETTYDEQKGDNFFSHFQLLTKNFGFNASMNFPKFLVPFRLDHRTRNLPRTIIGVGSNMLERVNYFTLNNTMANLTYNWKETNQKTWDITPAFVNIIRLPSVSDSFKRRLENNDFLRNSYRETFIQGENISFTYSNQHVGSPRSYTYARIGLEEGGGIISAVEKLIPIRFQFAQYVRLDFDLRRYINQQHSQVVLRVSGGAGMPYGGSQTLPYIKQFFVGGAYSIRGWRIRTLGPGGYYDPSLDSMKISYIDRTGDIKLEMNTEYRFDMLDLFSGSVKLKGALFADAGNIWLAKPSADYPKGSLDISRFGSDLAVSMGAGLRFDLAGFFIFRLDAAFPVKKPYEANGGWVFDQLSPWKRSWREENLVLNFAIGYPF